jgi:hypothetical protein
VRSGVGFGGVDPRATVHLESPGLTSLTGASHWSDRCRPVGLCSGECVGVFSVVLCCSCFEFGPIWRSEGQVRGFETSCLRPV